MPLADLSSLDPVTDLPLLVVNQIWDLLCEEDLLRCRLVSVPWRYSIENSLAWKNYIPASDPPAQNDCTAWQRYLNLKKEEACWRKGAFREHTTSLQPNDKVCVGGEFIYVGRDKQVIFYNNQLNVVLKQEHEECIVSLCAAGKMLAVVTKINSSRFCIVVYDGVQDSFKVEASSRRLALSADGKLCFIKENKLCLLEGGCVRKEYELPGDVSHIAIMSRYVAVMTVHPAFRGGGYSIFRTRKNGWEAVHECVNSSPMVHISGELLWNERALVVTECNYNDNIYSYGFLILFEMETKERLYRDSLEHSRTAYFRAALGKDYIVYTGNETVLGKLGLQEASLKTANIATAAKNILVRDRDQIIVYSKSIQYWRNMSFLYTLDLPFDITRSAIQKDCLVLWDKNVLMTFTVPKE